MARVLLFMLFSASAGAAESVVLNAESVVAGEFFTLGEIATVRSPDASLAKLRIGKSPRAGRALEVGRDQLARVLERLRPDLAGRLELGGAIESRVLRGPLEKIPFERLQAQARHELEKALASQYERYDVEPRGAEREALVVPAGRVELRARVPERLAGRVAVWTDVLVDGRHYQSVPSSFDVRGEPELPAPERLAALPVAVRQGDPVTVRLAAGGIEVETVALAMRAARAGEVINVRNAETNRTYRVRVTATGKVETLWR